MSKIANRARSQSAAHNPMLVLVSPEITVKKIIFINTNIVEGFSTFLLLSGGRLVTFGNELEI